MVLGLGSGRGDDEDEVQQPLLSTDDTDDEDAADEAPPAPAPAPADIADAPARELSAGDAQELTNALFGLPRNGVERVARAKYRFAYSAFKVLSFALTVLPGILDDGTREGSLVIWALTVANWFAGMMLHRYAMRETDAWANTGRGDTGEEDQERKTPLRTKLKQAILPYLAFVGLVNLNVFRRWAMSSTPDEWTTLQVYALEINAWYHFWVAIKRIISAFLVVAWSVAIFLPPDWTSWLTFSTGALNAFSAIVVVDLVDGFSKEESRIKREQEAQARQAGIASWLQRFVAKPGSVLSFRSRWTAKESEDSQARRTEPAAKNKAKASEPAGSGEPADSGSQ